MNKLEHGFNLKSKHHLLLLERPTKYHKAMLNKDDDQLRIELASRVKEAIKCMPRGTKTEIAKRLDISPTAITGWEKTGRIGKESIEVVAEMTGYNLSWLITGKGEKQHLALSGQLDTLNTGRRIPLIELHQAGAWKEALKNHSPGTGEIMISHEVGKNTFAVTLTSDSMAPRFSEGDVVLIDPELTPAHKDFVLVIIGGDVVLRQFWREAGKCMLKPLNQRFDDEPIGDNPIIGVATYKHFIEKLR